MQRQARIGIGIVVGTFLVTGAALLRSRGTGREWLTELVAEPAAPRRLSNPYEGIDWDRVHRLKTQFHDHISDRERIAAYDRAGYDAIPYFDYSGLQSSSSAWRERRWPVEKWLSREFIDSLPNVKLFFPSAEEIGAQHMTSPFLAKYVERWKPSTSRKKLPYHYQSGQELIDLIHRLGGLTFLAHPWEDISEYAGLHGYDAVEVYNAYATSRGRIHRERLLVEFWDRRLVESPTLWGVAVNDWFGPFFHQLGIDHDPPPTASVLDSGKTIVLAREVTSQAFHRAVERGAMFAVKDVGTVKDRFPRIDSVRVKEGEIRLATNGEVRWISNGETVGVGAFFRWSALPREARYLRAEVRNAESSVVFTQPFALIPVEPDR